MCCLCQLWIHKECEGITDDTFASLSEEGQLSEDDFLCRLCISGEDASQVTQDPEDQDLNPVDSEPAPVQGKNIPADASQYQADAAVPDTKGQ